MGYVTKKDSKIKNKKADLNISGYSLPSRKGKFLIDEVEVDDITITDPVIWDAFVTNVVIRKYNRLIKKLTEELVDDDNPDGEGLILDEIEKFRLEIKNKYRKYLDKKTLDKMARKLRYFINTVKEEKDAKKENTNTKGRSR